MHIHSELPFLGADHIKTIHKLDIHLLFGIHILPSHFNAIDASKDHGWQLVRASCLSCSEHHPNRNPHMWNSLQALNAYDVFMLTLNSAPQMPSRDSVVSVSKGTPRQCLYPFLVMWPLASTLMQQWVYEVLWAHPCVSYRSGRAQTVSNPKAQRGLDTNEGKAMTS